jgi:predicted secreted protein
MDELVWIGEVPHVPTQQVADAVDAAHGDMNRISLRRAGHHALLNQDSGESDDSVIDREQGEGLDERQRLLAAGNSGWSSSSSTSAETTNSCRRA